MEFLRPASITKYFISSFSFQFWPLFSIQNSCHFQKKLTITNVMIDVDNG